MTLLKGVLFRLLPTLFVLGGAELVLRALDLPGFDACWVRKEEFWRETPDAELGWTYLPGSVVAKAHINERGLRGELLPKEKPEGHYRLLFIGDSTAFGVGIPREHIFAQLSTEFLQQDHPEHRFEYLIGALPGYSSYHSRIMTERLLPLDPDLVIFYVGAHNDHSRGRYYSDGDIASRLARRHAPWHRVRVLRLAENWNDYLYRKFFRKLRSDAAKARIPPEAFRANVANMLARTRQAGARALVLLPPYSDHLLEEHPILPLYQQALEEVALAMEVPYVKLQEAFARHEQHEIYLGDLFHFDKPGHRIAAEEIRRAVNEEGLVPASAASDRANPERG